MTSSFQNLVGIEGVPGVGKTMSLLRLAQSSPGKIIVLPELNFASTDPFVEDETTDQWRIYHSLWSRRLRIIRAFPKTVPPFVFDRTYYSNIAYTYALATLTRDEFEYKIQKQQIHNDFTDIGVNSLLILDSDPLIGLQRRLYRGDQIPSPWNKPEFLLALQHFYRQIIPTLYSGQIIYIKCDTSSLEETAKQLATELARLIKMDLHLDVGVDLSTYVDEGAGDAVARLTEDLGPILAGPIWVLGSPTYYFRQHAVQLSEGKPSFLNNDRLNALCVLEWMKAYQSG